MLIQLKGPHVVAIKRATLPVDSSTEVRPPLLGCPGLACRAIHARMTRHNTQQVEQSRQSVNSKHQAHRSMSVLLHATAFASDCLSWPRTAGAHGYSTRTSHLDRPTHMQQQLLTVPYHSALSPYKSPKTYPSTGCPGGDHTAACPRGVPSSPAAAQAAPHAPPVRLQSAVLVCTAAWRPH